MLRSYPMERLLSDLGVPDKDNQQRKEAIYILTQLGKVMPNELIRLLEIQDGDIAIAIAAILITIGTQAVDGLNKALNRSRNLQRTQIMIDILEGIGGERAAGLLDEISQSENRDLSQAAIDAKCQILAQQYRNLVKEMRGTRSFGPLQLNVNEREEVVV
jgi:hypothetical protein